MNTPWGKADRVIAVDDGITLVTTPSHGGYKLDAKRNAMVPIDWRKASFNGQGLHGWYEEDCDWSLVALTFPDAFPPDALDAARKTFAGWIAPKLRGAA